MIKPIETQHNGYLFRSRLEARWAVLFDTIGIEYQYEPEGFNLNGEWYLPDFWLPRFGCWVEIKPDEPNSQEVHKCQLLAQLSGQPVYLFYGEVWHDLPEDRENGILFDSLGRFHAQFVWMRCLNCGNVSLANREVIPFSDGTAAHVPIGNCFCEAFYGVVTTDVEAAYVAARQARFEQAKAA